MTIQTLRCFREIAERGSMARSAAVLGVSQPYLSKTMKSLEKELGTTLFVREGRHLTLSRSGSLFYPYVCTILSAAEDAGRALRKSLEAHARLTVTTLNMARLLPDFLAEFSIRHPDIDYTLKNFRSVDTVAPESDCLIHASREALQKFPATEPLFEEECLIGMSVRHPLAARDILTVEDLAGEQFLMLRRDNTLGELTRDYLNSLGLGTRAPAICDSQVMLSTLVSENMGLAIFPGRTWTINQRRFTLKRLKGHRLSRTIYLSMPDKTPREETLVFCREFKDFCRRLPEET